MPRLHATQANYPIVVKTPLEEDKLLFHSMSGTEQLGRLFQYELELLSNDPEIKLEDLLGGNATVSFQRDDGEFRHFNGYISRFSQTGTHGEYYVYQASLQSWLWFLTRTADCRIFQDKKVPDIIKEIFRERGFSDYEELLSKSYRTWSYCVQYRETDFNFISRLMEQEGIYYYFKHDNGKHTLIISDSIGSHESVPGYEEVPYYPPEETDRRERDYISSWTLSKEIQPGVYALNDFDFEKPRANLQVKSAIIRDHEQANFEIFDYPGEYDKTGDGENYARARIEELQAQYELVEGSGNVSGLTTGCLFSLTNYGREDQNREYLVVSVTYDLGPQEYESRDSGNDAIFNCAFNAIDSQQPFRSACTTPKPVVQGPQTAIVVGKSGEEIWTDKHGRVKVQFHWDRYSKADETSSCWIRVAQVWAGKNWGGIFIPRIGQEVIVEFLEGDPDCPIITGRVYNGMAKPPYGLPGEATKTTIKSNSSKGGGGFNEFRFEDKKGEEQVFIHAEKNQDNRVKNNTFEWIGNERHLIVKKDQLEQVDGDKHLTVKGDSNAKVSGTVSMDAGMDFQQKVGMNHAVDAGMEIHLKAGMNVVIEAGMSITLKAGGGFVVVGPTGVTISGTPVLINSGGSAGSGSGCSPDAAKPPKEAATAEPGSVAEVQARSPAAASPSTLGVQKTNPQAKTLTTAAENGTPFCEQCEAAKKAQAQQQNN